MNIDYRVISLGTLSAHPLWDEKGERRTGHATTTLITTDDAKIVVNPGLPAQILQARMDERVNLQPRDITHVFMTSLTQDHYRGLRLFEQAEWYAFEAEGIAALAGLRDQLERAKSEDDDELEGAIQKHLELVRRCRAAEDTITKGVDLFPLPGVTPGSCGLILSLPRQTVLITGDAVATYDHLQQGKVLPHSANIEQAQESFKEAVEIADILILGRGNITFNPFRWSGY